MSIQNAYNQWSEIYDVNENKTRDLEAFALKKILKEFQFSSILEIGCGTGKNTEWLITQCETIVAVDFSELMLQKAKEKSSLKNVDFLEADITNDWNFIHQQFDLVSCSLVLEHIENLNHIFHQAFQKLKKNGYLYIGELHPFKQYEGSKARFETEQGLTIVNCFTHHISEFISIGINNNFKLIHLEEFFDDDNKNSTPRIISILFQKN